MNQSQKKLIKKAFISQIINGKINKIKIMGSSMLPTISSQEYVRVKSFDGVNKDIKIGDIVIAGNPNNDKPLVVHRVIAIDLNKNLITLKGDNQDECERELYSLDNVYGRVIANKSQIKNDLVQIVVDLPYKLSTSFNTKTYEIYQILKPKNNNCYYLDLNLKFNEMVYTNSKIQEFKQSDISLIGAQQFLKYLDKRRLIYKKIFNLHHFTIANLTLTDYKDECKIKEILSNYKETIYYNFFKNAIMQAKQSFANNTQKIEFIFSVDSFDKLITSTIFSMVLQEILDNKPILVDNSSLFNSKYNATFWEKYFKEIKSMSSICKTDIKPLTTFEEIDFDKYITYSPFATLRFMGECYYKKCLFCDRHGKDNFCYNVDNIFQKIKNLKQHNINKIVFVDDCLSINNVLKLIDLLNENNIKIQWKGTFRFEKKLNDRKIINKLKKSGCKMIFFGLESFDQTYLDFVHKGIKVKDAKKILKLCKKAKIKTSVSFLFNFYNESINSLNKTYKNLKKYIKFIDYFEFNNYVPTANAKLESWDSLNYYKTPKLNDKNKLQVINSIKNLTKAKNQNSFYLKNIKIWE